MSEYVTTAGYRLGLKPVNTVLVQLAIGAVSKRLREQGMQIDPPRFSIMTVGGPQWFDHTERTLDDPADPYQTARNHAMWDAYQETRRVLDAERREQELYVMLSQGVECPEDWDAGDWAEQQRALGIEIPEDNEARRIHWLTTVAMSRYDYVQVISKLQILAQERMVTEDQVSSFLRRVWGKVEGAVRADTRRTLARLGRALAG